MIWLTIEPRENREPLLGCFVIHYKEFILKLWSAEPLASIVETNFLPHLTNYRVYYEMVFDFIINTRNCPMMVVL